MLQKEGQKPPEIRNYWIGSIQEIRASSNRAVYLRIFWMYWPRELPQYCTGVAEGRLPCHGASELIASNHSKAEYP